ncbi:MAG: hypothetical protein AB1768_18645 [Pseudomonadota bacterium]
MFQLFVHDDAEGDLERLWGEAPEAAARIAVLLEEVEGNPDLLDCLTQHDFGSYHSADFHVSRWVEQWKKGRDLWRLKVWDLEDKGLRYRVVYAFVPGKLQYHVLGIVPRDFNYDVGNELTRRILRTYEDL